MPRRKKKPEYNPALSMGELLNAVADAYGTYDDRESDSHDPSLNSLAEEFDLNVLKVRKLLITAGVYSTSTSRRNCRACGMSTDEISEEMELSRASVNSYLPYGGFAYKLPETSVEADRSKIYRMRRLAVSKLKREICESRKNGADNRIVENELLWNCVLRFEGYRFKTAKGLPFTYEVKKTKVGSKSGEVIFSRKSKGVTRATVNLAYDRVTEERLKQDKNVPVMKTPKKLDVFGASYLYAIFLRFGLISAG